MRTKVLSLNVDRSMSFTRFQARIESSINNYTDDCVFQQFEDIREMFVALQSALENDELIITAVDVKNYLKFKNALIQAFGTDIAYNSTVLRRVENLSIEDKKKKAFSAFPEPATVFVSDDGLYSGFAMANGSQYLILLPIDNYRIDEILRNGVIPYLNEQLMAKYDDIVLTTEKPAYFDKVSFAVNSILECDSLVAVNGTRNAEVLKSCGDEVIGFDKAFVFTPYVEDKGKINPTEYTAQLARVSLDLSSAKLGACISDIYTSNDAKYICIAVSDGDSALVRKLYMSDNETEHEFVESAAVELIELIGEKVSGKRSVGIEFADEQENAITDDDKKIAKKKPLAILAIIIGLVFIICAIFAFIFQSKDNSDLFASLFSNEESSTTETTTEPISTTEPVTSGTTAYDESMMKLSDYIVSTIMSMDEATIQNNISEYSKEVPEFITVNGEQIPAKQALARLVTAEISNGYNYDAVKAYTVAAYTCLKVIGNDFVLDNVRISQSSNGVVIRAVDDVFGEYLTYNNFLAVPLFHNLTAVSTLDMSAKLPYLKSVKLERHQDVNVRNYETSKVYSVDEMKAILLKNNSSVVLSENPAEWIVVKEHDASVSAEVGNVKSVVFNGTEMTGIEFKMKVMGDDKLASICFQIVYNAETSSFIVTTYGQGYGIGMGQIGAKYLSVNDHDYKAILAKYYEGTTVTKG
ncbi:MAG: hypothetical protein IJA80_04555 [Clostridia bacterium]|nr:hypothetical protein [Clostridia bacterium]